MKPRVEVRSMTGAEYSRAGARWSPQWTELDERKFTKAQLRDLRADTHLEFRFDGKRIRGGARESEAVDDEDALDRDELVEKLRETIADLRARGIEQKAKSDDLEKELAALKASNEALSAKLTELTVAKAAAPTETAAKPPSPTAPPDTPPAPIAPATEPAKGPKAKG